MGKKLAKLIGKEGSFKCHYGSYYGIYNKFDVVIKYDYTSLIYNTYFSIDGKLNVDKLNDELQKIDKYAIAKYKNNNLTITQSCDRLKDMPELANKILKKVTDFLNKNNCKNVCKNCHKNNETSLISIDDNIMYYCNDCYKNTLKKYEDEIKKNKSIKENIPSGIIGAIVGAIPGLIIWLLLSYLMINPSVIALIIMFGSAYGYKLFAKSMKLPGLIISLFIGFAIVYFANNLSNSYTLYNEYFNQYKINIIDTYKALPYYLNNSTLFKSSYNQNLLLSLMFALFGGFTNIGIYRGYLANNKIKKVVIK